MGTLLKGLIKLLVVACALLAIASFVPGIAIADVPTAFLVALIWGLVMLLIKPILSLLTFPINLLTLGLFSFVVNALLFWSLSTFIPGFSVAGFLPALEGSVLLSIVNGMLHIVF